MGRRCPICREQRSLEYYELLGSSRGKAAHFWVTMCYPCWKGLDEVLQLCVVKSHRRRKRTGWWEDDTFYPDPTLEDNGFVVVELDVPLMGSGVEHSTDQKQQPA